jgi:Glycosyltransferase
MNIVGIFLNNEMRTGANRRYLELMESLAEKGNSVAVIMNTHLKYAPTHFRRIEIPVRYKRRRFPPASFLFRKAIADRIDFLMAELGKNGLEGIDWIHIHGDIHFPSALYLKRITVAKLFFAFRCNDITRAAILRKHGAYTASEHALSYILNIKDWFRERKIAKESDLITFQNSIDRDIFLARVGSLADIGKTVIIPGNIGLPRFTKETEQKNNSTSVVNLVYVGAVSLSKGLGSLLEAMAILHDHGHADLRLSVLGKIDGSEKAFTLVKKLQIGNMVSFEGYTLPFPFLERCDLMVYPTLYDAFPDTILEALHVGCPVIASRVGGIPEMLESSELLFEIGNAAEIAEKIEICISDPDHYRHIRNLCAKRYKEFTFDWAERFANSMNSH